MTDHEIIAQVLSGDQDAYATLMERYYRGLVCHVFIMVRDNDLADDLSQEAFVKAYFALKKYKPEFRFSTWLYRIATNLTLDHLRRKQHISLDDLPELPAPEPTDGLKVEQREALVRQAVTHLPLKFQTVISLHYWQEFKYEEVAEILSVPVGTIKTWLFRAKGLLKEELDGQI